jgi:hypothetical protein
MQVGQLEAQLFEQFFTPGHQAGAGAANGSTGPRPPIGASAAAAAAAPAAAASSEQLVPVMEPLCNVLYDVLRPLVVQLQDVDELCELVDILKHEVRGIFKRENV